MSLSLRASAARSLTLSKGSASAPRSLAFRSGDDHRRRVRSDPSLSRHTKVVVTCTPRARAEPR
jgi:hypothetical protein